MSSEYSLPEKITAFHLALMGVFAAWAFGGGVDWAITVISVLGSLAPVITLLALRERRTAKLPSSTTLYLLIPLLGFNALVLLGIMQPALRVVTIENSSVFIPRSDLSAWPCSARPEFALKELWLFDAIVLSCINLLIAIRHRGILRTLLLVLVANALLLSLFGSFQKFTNASGLFFGQVPSPNSTFFASFIYHNHWGAFVVLILSVCLGLLFNLRPWSGYRDFWHSPALVTVVAIFFLAATIPLSTSRSCSLLAILILTGALLHGLRRIFRHLKEQGRSTIAPSFFLILTVIVALGMSYLLARPMIEERVADTRDQLSHMREIGGLGARAQLYGDTWRMANDRLWFGWGLGSYGTVFSLYNTQHASDNLPQHYEDAHSDWLQLLAETGAIGFFLFITLLATPLMVLSRLGKISSLPQYLFAGCALILLYAGIEFPFGNPAVTLTFWTCYFCAVRWVQLESCEHSG